MRRLGSRSRSVVVTGIGLVTSLGTGKADNWRELTAGHSGVRRITRFSTEGMKVSIAACAKTRLSSAATAPELCFAFADQAIEEALAESAIAPRGHFPGPLFLGVPPLELDWSQRLALGALAEGPGPVNYEKLLRVVEGGAFLNLDEVAEHGIVAMQLKARYGIRSTPVSINTACASGATAIQLGVEAIRRGETEAALCVATDSSVTPETMIRFSLLSALSTQNEFPTQASKPFSRTRDGFVMGEGAGALVLESVESARARGARILGQISGVGESVDPFHKTRASPEGKPIAACIRNAIEDAGLQPDEVDYINVHGTSTPENDKTEYLGIAAVMTSLPPVSSNKSMIGHTLSAAGAIEAAFTLLTLQQQRLPPTINYRDIDPEIPLDVVPNVARDARVRHALSNSFGFGGQNVSLVISRFDF